MKVSELDKPFAAEVTGIDLSQPLSDQAFGEILAAWMLHPILAFRDQTLDTEQQQRFSERFGQLKTRLRQSGQQGATTTQNPYMMFVSNIKENGKLIGTSPVGALNFHSDSSFDERPSKAGLLYGMEIPSVGGDTLFVDMCEIYDDLPRAMKEYLKDKWAVNIHLPSLPLDPTQTQEERIRTARRAIHPMVIAHPESGRPILYANRHQTHCVFGVPESESAQVLGELFDRVDSPDVRYAHKWRTNDLVLWDNRRAQHGRSDFNPTERRLLRRFAVFCEARPRAFDPACGPAPQEMANA